MSLEQIGLLLNLLVTVAGFVGLLLKFENRMTRVETLLEWFLPKPKRDGGGDGHERG